MGDVMEDESGGGVMILFSTDPEKQEDVAHAMQYTVQALRTRQLKVTENVSNSKTSQPR